MGIRPEPPVPPPWAPTLTDGAVTLRAHRDTDVPDIVAHCSDPLMARWTRVPQPYAAADAISYVSTRRSEWESMRELGFAIEHEGRYAGSVDLRPAEGHTAEVGYALAPWARGRGVMTAALRLLLPWAFDQLGLGAVHWRSRTGNWNSRRVAWATGFRVEGQVRCLLGAGEVAHDAWVGSLLRQDPLHPAHLWLTPPALIGNGVLLRAHRPPDVPRIVEACADASTQQWLPLIPSPYGHPDALAHLEQLMSEQAVGEAVSWAVADPRSDLLLGEIGVFGLGGGTGRYGEIGYWTHPQARGQGLTTEALRLVARHSLLPLDEGGLGLPRVVVRAARGNVASQRVALNAGFRPAGVDRAGEVLRDGSVQDLLRFDLLPDEVPVPPQRSPRPLLRTPDAPLTPPHVERPGGGTRVLDLDRLPDADRSTADAGREQAPTRSFTPRNGVARVATGNIPILGGALARRAAGRPSRSAAGPGEERPPDAADGAGEALSQPGGRPGDGRPPHTLDPPGGGRRAHTPDPPSDSRAGHIRDTSSGGRSPYPPGTPSVGRPHHTPDTPSDVPDHTPDLLGESRPHHTSPGAGEGGAASSVPAEAAPVIDLTAADGAGAQYPVETTPAAGVPDGSAGGQAQSARGRWARAARHRH